MRLPKPSHFVVSDGLLASGERLFSTTLNRRASRILIPVITIARYPASTSLPFFNSTHARFTHGETIKASDGGRPYWSIVSTIRAPWWTRQSRSHRCNLGGLVLIEVEVQNETYQTQHVIRFAAVPRIGEGIHLLDQAGFSACFDVVDVWYQKASYGDLWIPYIHVRKTPAISASPEDTLGRNETLLPQNSVEHVAAAQASALAERFS